MMVRRLVLMFALAGVAASHGDGPAERKRRGDSYFLDGQFDGFVRQQLPRHTGAPQQTSSPSIRINSSAPLRARSACETPDLGPHTTLHPYACGENGAWVEVSGQCATSTGVWWAGIFPASAPASMHTIDPAELPGNNTMSPWTPPFMVPAPLKFSSVHCAFNLSKSGTNDPIWRRWWVPNTRQPVVFILFNGSESSAHEAARSDPISFVNSDAPMHLRLGRTHSVSEMRVSWTSSCSHDSGDLLVKWGTDPKQLVHAVAATSATCEFAKPPRCRVLGVAMSLAMISLKSCGCLYALSQTPRRICVANRPKLWAGGSRTGSTQQSLTSCSRKKNLQRCTTTR